MRLILGYLVFTETHDTCVVLWTQSHVWGLDAVAKGAVGICVSIGEEAPVRLPNLDLGGLFVFKVYLL